MIMNKEKITESQTYKKYIRKKNITQRTLDTYIYSLQQFCNANQKELDPMIQEVLEEQYPYIDEQGRIHEYNPEYSKIDNYLNNTATYLKGKGNSNNSIQAHLIRIRAVLSSLNVKLPKPIELEKDNKEWYGLTKEDIQYINSISPLHHQALITFMAHTGIRTGDVIQQFTIETFMKATYKYHECEELDDFLEKAPLDMVGYWEFIPQKTRKHNVECKVYNTAESSNLILKSLHMRKESIEALNKKNGTNLKLEKSDALFSSRNQNFKGKLYRNTLTVLSYRRNQELRKHRLRLLKQDLDNGVISEETYHQKVEQIPVFHAHALRKFFITTLSRKRVDLRASALLEGHSPIMQDKSYVDNDKLDELLWEEYQRVIPALSFLKSEEDYEMSKTNKELTLENAHLRNENKKLEEDKLNMKEDFKREAKQLLDELLRENNITL